MTYLLATTGTMYSTGQALAAAGIRHHAAPPRYVGKPRGKASRKRSATRAHKGKMPSVADYRTVVYTVHTTPQTVRELLDEGVVTFARTV
jgi:hypothetical protein